MTTLNVKIIGDHEKARQFAAYLSEVLQADPPGGICSRVVVFSQDKLIDAKRYQLEFDYRFEPQEESSED